MPLIEQKFSMKHLQGCTVTFFAVVFFSSLTLYYTHKNMDLLKFEPKENSAINFRKERIDPPSTNDLCTFKPLPPAEAAEEEFLMKSTAWPETPRLSHPLSLEQTSDPAHSFFTVLPPRRGEWHVGDQLEVLIKIYDFQGHAKKFGGDLLVPRLYNESLDAGVAGRVVDHLNGSYSVTFPLLWVGDARVEVILDLSSEAITVLHMLNREHPDRIIFENTFRSGSVSEKTICNICLRETDQPQCNFTHPRTGEPWFCYKPPNLGCDTRIYHRVSGFKEVLKDDQERLFQSGVNSEVPLKASGKADIIVLPQRKEQTNVNENSGQLGTSGYYYGGLWRALNGTRVQQFLSSDAISQCLKGKIVQMYGDSTMRQWFEFLKDHLPDASEVNLNSPYSIGPFILWDKANKFTVAYRTHGPPYRSPGMPTCTQRYIADEIDTLVGGTNTVVVLSIWAHFITFPIELYIRRLQNIRRAVVHLLDRAPGTLVVIRTGNLQKVQFPKVLRNGNWLTVQVDQVLRAMFKGLNVQWVEAWEMVQAHHLQHNLHPPPPIVSNMVNVLLSYICPKNKD